MLIFLHEVIDYEGTKIATLPHQKIWVHAKMIFHDVYNVFLFSSHMTMNEQNQF